MANGDQLDELIGAALKGRAPTSARPAAGGDQLDAAIAQALGVQPPAATVSGAFARGLLGIGQSTLQTMEVMRRALPGSLGAPEGGQFFAPAAEALGGAARSLGEPRTLLTKAAEGLGSGVGFIGLSALAPAVGLGPKLAAGGLGVLYVLPEARAHYRRALPRNPEGAWLTASFWQKVLQPVGVTGLVLGAGIGATCALPDGLFVGGFVGLLAGLVSSGIYLMIYRAIRHARNKHD